MRLWWGKLGFCTEKPPAKKAEGWGGLTLQPPWAGAAGLAAGSKRKAAELVQ